MTYFSEREQGPRALEHERIGDPVWGGIQALVGARIADGSFGASYSELCPDEASRPVGTDEEALSAAMRAEIPNLQARPWLSGKPRSTLDILDMIEFCWLHIGKPTKGRYHQYFDHHHLSFDIEEGQDEFREAINRIFRRNGLVYALNEEGCVERLAPPVLREELASAQFRTGEEGLDRMLETARRKFFNPDVSTRHEALEALWDAWERLKTLDGADKKAQITALLNVTAGTSSPKLRDALEKEAMELTRIGNNLQIRHSETDRERIRASEHIDYLFHRLFALITVILRTNKKRKRTR
jgi:hypothetical protein